MRKIIRGISIPNIATILDQSKGVSTRVRRSSVTAELGSLDLQYK